MKYLLFIPFIFFFSKPQEPILNLKPIDKDFVSAFYLENPNLESMAVDSYIPLMNDALGQAKSKLSMDFGEMNSISFLINNPTKKTLLFLDNNGKILYSSAQEKIHSKSFNQRILTIKSKEGFDDIKIRKCYISYQDLDARTLSFGFGTSLPCMENINCYPDIEEQLYKKSVVRIVMALEEGTGYCTGTLMNNTAQDDTPYVLSAYHCDFGYTPIHEFWRFDFNYEAVGCLDPVDEPIFNSLTGCYLRAQRFESDFQLFEIDEPIIYDYDVYFMGWDRRENTIPSHASIIHHPSGDIKKYSKDNDPLIIYGLSLDWGPNYGITPANHHFRSYLDLNRFEPGSSGCALLDENYRVVGQLNGGNNGCMSNAGSYYGRFYYSWFEGGTPSSELKDWLDPMNNEDLYMDGKVQDIPLANIEGDVLGIDGMPVPNTKIYLGGFELDTTITDIAGHFVFEQKQTGQSYTLTPFKDTDPAEFLDNNDLLKIGHHILETEAITDSIQLKLADVNMSGTITGADVVLIRRMILGFNTTYPDVDMWSYLWPMTYMPLTSVSVDLDVDGTNMLIYAIKKGNVDW